MASSGRSTTMAKPFLVSAMRRSTYAYVERLIQETKKGLAIVVDRPLEAIGDQGAATI